MENMELICCEIISSVGEAKSLFIEAMHAARGNHIPEAMQLMQRGNECLAKGHKVHVSLIQKEARGEDVKISLILIHTEDQLMNAETSKLQAEEFIHVYKRMEEGGGQL